MDAEKLLAVFTPIETQEVAAALPDDLIKAEMARRGLAAAPGLGAVTAEAAGLSPVGDPEAVEAPKSRFEQQLSAYLDPETEMSLDDQLEVASEALLLLGLTAPTLSHEEHAKLEKATEANPRQRVLPTPQLDVAGLIEVSEKAKAVFSNNNLHPSYEALWIPEEGSLTGKLLRNPERAVKEGGEYYVLGFRSADGKVVTEAAFRADRAAAGLTVEDANAVSWEYPVTDVQVDSPRTYDSAANLHEKANSSSPTALVIVLLLHQANGTPNASWDIDMTNVGVYKVTVEEDKGETNLRSVVGVYFSLNARQLNLRSWGAGSLDADFGVRDAQSGLAEA